MRHACALALLLGLTACQAWKPTPYGWWQSISVAGRDSCIGVAIDTDWVLTVRHCVQRQGDRLPIPPAELTMIDQEGTKRQVLRVVVPASPFNHLGDITGRDVALLKVDRPLVRVADLGSWVDHQEKILLRSRENQISAIRIEIRPFDGQSGYSRGVTCVGDSGSPLMDATGKVAGLASWRSEPHCDRGISVFTRLDIHRDWIESNT